MIFYITYGNNLTRNCIFAHKPKIELKMKMNLVLAMVIAAMIGSVGCTNQKKHQSQKIESNSQVIVQDLQQSNTIFGTYKGTFPCADCGGKDIDLTISEDGTYCLKYQYQDKDERQVEENGTYSIIDDTLVVTVTPSSGEKTYYKYMQGNLVLSDSLGTVNDGELAEHYVLKRKD